MSNFFRSSLPPPPPIDSIDSRSSLPPPPPIDSIDSLSSLLPPPPPIDSLSSLLPPPPPIDSLSSLPPPRNCSHSVEPSKLIQTLRNQNQSLPVHPRQLSQSSQSVQSNQSNRSRGFSNEERKVIADLTNKFKNPDGKNLSPEEKKAFDALGENKNQYSELWDGKKCPACGFRSNAQDWISQGFLAHSFSLGCQRHLATLTQENIEMHNNVKQQCGGLYLNAVRAYLLSQYGQFNARNNFKPDPVKVNSSSSSAPVMVNSSSSSSAPMTVNSSFSSAPVMVNSSVFDYLDDSDLEFEVKNVPEQVSGSNFVSNKFKGESKSKKRKQESNEQKFNETFKEIDDLQKKLVEKINYLKKLFKSSR